MGTLSRADVARWAGITLPQLDHFGTAGVAAADVGGERKRFSIAEARTVVIAGRCLKYGMTPRSLVEPIGWMRDYSKWPAIDGLPKNLAEIEIELLADRLRHLVDFSPQEKTNAIGWHLYAFAIGRHLQLPTPDEVAARKTEFKAALKSDDVNLRSRAEEATKRAEKMLGEPPKWSIDEINQAERALQFELACRGERDLFVHLATADDGWKTFVSPKVERIEGDATWLVIDIKTLFRERGALIA
jgi:hypothetical protein